MYSLLTDYPIAYSSPDNLYPQGTKNVLGGPDYTWKDGFNPFVDEVVDYFKTQNIRVLDLGAASGYLVKDFLSRGCDAIGLEGSDWSIINNIENWSEYKNTRLFTCDISQPFSILYNGKPAKFNLINAWEVVEHIDPSNLPTLVENIYNHLDDEGIFVCSISPWFEPSRMDPSINLHLSHNIKSKREWENIFSNFEFFGPIKEQHNSGYHYIFKNRYRGIVREAEGGRHTFWSTLRKKSL